MDDVKAMSRAGETVGKAVGSGWLAVRRGARRAGKASAEATANAAHAADRKLAERGVAPRQLTDAFTEGAELARQEVAKTTRRTRKKLARTAKHTRKELAKAAKQARKEAKKVKPAKVKARVKKAAEAPGKRRRWPKVLLLTAVVAGVAYVVRSKAAPSAPTPVPEPRHRANADEPDSTATNAEHNGRPTKESTSKRS